MIRFGKNIKVQEILVIEDDKDFSESLCQMLASRGYGVTKAQTGRDGLDLLKQHPADLVITDVVLPDQDGIHMILNLQKAFPGVKIIAVSGGGRCASGEEYLSDIQLYCHIEHTLARPFDKNKLFKMVRKILS